MVLLCNLCNIIIDDLIDFELRRLNLLGVQFTMLSACRPPKMTTPPPHFFQEGQIQNLETPCELEVK